jgi:hypothetical protein
LLLRSRNVKAVSALQDDGSMDESWLLLRTRLCSKVRDDQEEGKVPATNREQSAFMSTKRVK